jgi:hypothetical protein
MKGKIGTTIVIVLFFALVALGISCVVTGGLGLPLPGGISQQEESDGDCDAGDLRESKPDSDCNGLWLGTPTPGARKTTAPAATKGSAPKPATTRRR